MEEKIELLEKAKEVCELLEDLNHKEQQCVLDIVRSLTEATYHFPFSTLGRGISTEVLKNSKK